MINPRANLDDKNFYKNNYVKATEILTPKVYLQEDVNLFGTTNDLFTDLINSHLNIANNFSSVININTYNNSIYSGIKSLSGVAQFFINKNNLTDIDLVDFEKKILIPLGYSVRDFTSSADFSNFLASGVIPKIRLNNPTFDFVGNGQVSSNHEYLINNLSWLYFLNTSGKGNLSYQPSSYVRDVITDKLFYARDVITTKDGIIGLTEYVWKNYQTCAAAWNSLQLLPTQFVSSVSSTSSIYTSGTQLLDKLKTLNAVLYSTDSSDLSDDRVEDAFNLFIDAGTKESRKNSAGPFYKFLRGISFAFADYQNKADELENLNDLLKCPDDYLPYLADIIGWRLFGNEPDRWRLQLANAINVYKAAGTKKSLQFALDSVFTKDVFSVSANIQELWESYVPHLMYYALATESSNFDSMDSWNPQKASILGINYYNPSSLDENVKMAVDTIIGQLIQEYPDNFRIGPYRFPIYDPRRTPFEILSPNADPELCFTNECDALTPLQVKKLFLFRYRGRPFPIPVPPFEEYSYYVKTEITSDMIDSIVDKLICFGVKQSFAFLVGDYIRANTIAATDDLRLGNSWLMFTASSQLAPNFSELIYDISNKKSEYLSLWNGKSSHYKLNLQSSSFNFAKRSLEVDSGEAIKILAEVADTFSPAHAVKDLNLFLSTIDNTSYAHTELPIVDLVTPDYAGLGIVSSTAFQNVEISALPLNLWKRNTQTGRTLTRNELDSLTDIARVSGTVSILPRSAFRRKNYKKLLNLATLYTYNGHNMPLTMDSVVNASGFLVLGLIPSSLQYVPVNDHVDIPPIYQYCENLNSRSIFSGLIVSSTFPCRGHVGLGSNAKVYQEGSAVDYYLDRSGPEPIINVINSIIEASAVFVASSYLDANKELLVADSNWKNNIQSYANTLINATSSVTSNDIYYDFKFGKGIHKLYKSYINDFSKHTLNKNLFDLNGPHIFAHTFGSIHFNSDLDILGSATTSVTPVISTSEGNIYELVVGTSAFPVNGGGLGCTRTNAASSLTFNQDFELVNPHIISGVELIHPVSGSRNNSFAVLKFEGYSNKYKTVPYMLDNTLIKLKSIRGVSRVKFDLKKYPHSSDYPLSTNFLTPDHDFTLKVKYLGGNVADPQKVGQVVGVWIHTSLENDYVWSFVPNGLGNKEFCYSHAGSNGWVMTKRSDLKQEYILNNLIFVDTYTNEEADSFVPATNKFKCIKFESNQNNPYSIYSNENFKQLEIKFDTRNRTLEVPEEYYKNNGSVHKLSQNYFVEVFVLPNSTNVDDFVLLDSINLVDNTLNDWSQYLVSSLRTAWDILGNTGLDVNMDHPCLEYKIPLTKDQIYTIIRYFLRLQDNAYGSPLASRVAVDTSGYFGVSGGSRLDYRIMPNWNTIVYSAGNSSYPITQLYLNN